MPKARSLAARPLARTGSNVHRLPVRRVLPRPVATLRAAALVGAGLAAIAEHVVFVQLLGWHGVASARLGLDAADPGQLPALLRAEAVAEGVFLAVAWLVVAAGCTLLWRAAAQRLPPASLAAFSGAAIAGWGAYQVLEGLLLHVVLGLHHVHDGPLPQLGDGAWIVGGALLVGIGWEFCRPPGETRS
jgi:uncharacterized membrane protein